MNYTELDSKLQGRNKESRKIANNTYLIRRGNSIAVKLHNTDVVTFNQNGSIVLNSGGWHTPTTKSRINQFIGNRLSQVNGVWYINGCRFADNMAINPDGTLSGCEKDNPKTDKKLKAKVKAYAKLCADSIPLEPPSGGDCWHCHMVTESKQTLGDVTKSDHIDSHMEESYIVPSLVYNALKEAGNTDFILALVFNNPDKFQMDIARERVYKSVYKYILKRKGYAV